MRCAADRSSEGRTASDALAAIERQRWRYGSCATVPSRAIDRFRRRLGWAALVTALAVTACGGGGDGADGSTGNQPEAAESDDGVSEVDVDGMALGLDSFPDRWVERGAEDAAVGGLACLQYLDIPPIREKVVDEAIRTFSPPSGMPTVRQSLTLFTDAQAAQQIMADLSVEIERCSAFPGAGQIAGPVSDGFTSYPPSEIDGADDVSGWRLEADVGGGIPLKAHLLVMRSDAALISLLSVNMGSGPTGEMEALAAHAVSRLE